MMGSNRPVAVLWDERFLRHNTGAGHPESAARLRAIKPVLDGVPELIRLAGRLATEKEILWAHRPEHWELISSSQGRSGFFDADTAFSPASYEAALLAVGGFFVGLDWVIKNAGRFFHFPRPPGHHAESNRIMGFCLLNTVALGAEYLLRQHGLKKIVIVDFDVHHGNGTQEIFYERGDVFYISLHQYPFYPGTGSATERGSGKGLGATLNFPMAAGSGDDVYRKTFNDSLIPAIENFQPDFILVSAGFDAHRDDPLGGLNLTEKAYAMMSGELIKAAVKLCNGKVAFVLEGGYNLRALALSVEQVINQMFIL